MNKNGKIYVVGIGPGKKGDMTFRAYEAIGKSDVIVGYKTYTDLVKEYYPDKEIVSSSMMKEVDRCTDVLKMAKDGKNVALISSGDAGVYGMAGIMLEIADDKIEVEVIPGVTATNAAAAITGAPVMHDYVTISLSNLLTDWELIKKRLELAAQGDFVVSIYNPKSRGRVTQIEEAQKIMLKYKPKTTPVAIVRNARRENEEYVVTTLEEMTKHEIDMLTIVIIGNSNTYVKNEKIITPRGYSKKYEY
ncbi:precorrin-3B C(17)-methyltransferase [Leptotrichia sp. oral taxon 847]|uniref:precorrin-3B C(17)-methyltransferase n=1 Tax=Leptotrichia sp. oral taxon 847 TaxID=1785996 RepID=UPI00076821F6|nr:precorrin-3B C(17)-methyltransferase [Leptotrichia sp. oral taxon 847]AMD94776.1 cobalt-precorrin-3B C(17)-methyltransferase [Leptotrichia sp. oral taxon 847]